MPTVWEQYKPFKSYWKLHSHTIIFAVTTSAPADRATDRRHVCVMVFNLPCRAFKRLTGTHVQRRHFPFQQNGVCDVLLESE